MKDVRIILVGGIKDDKADKLTASLKEGLSKLEMNPVVKFVNVYEVQDLTPFDADNDLVISTGGKIQTNLPVVQGMGLLYPWMGLDQVFNEIANIVN